MKKRSLTPQEEYTGVAPELNRTTRVRKISPKAWVSAVISLVMSLALFVLYYLAYSGTGDRDKIVLFYCSKRFFPYVSMSNSLSAADFDYDVIDIPENRNTKDNERYKIPDQYSGRQIVVCTFGKDAFKVMDKVAKANDGKIAVSLTVNSSHHQAVKDPAPGIRITAHAPDGIVEAYEYENVLAVQFHPERMVQTDASWLVLFKHFVDSTR